MCCEVGRGTRSVLIDGRKTRSTDSVLVGDFLMYCEVGRGTRRAVSGAKIIIGNHLFRIGLCTDTMTAGTFLGINESIHLCSLQLAKMVDSAIMANGRSA